MPTERDLVGRRAELTQPSGVLTKGAHRAVVVSGEPGIGRTASVEQMCAVTTPQTSTCHRAPLIPISPRQAANWASRGAPAWETPCGNTIPRPVRRRARWERSSAPPRGTGNPVTPGVTLPRGSDQNRGKSRRPVESREIVVLGDDRQSARDGDRRDPQIVDPHPATCFGEMDT